MLKDNFRDQLFGLFHVIPVVYRESHVHTTGFATGDVGDDTSPDSAFGDNHYLVVARQKSGGCQIHARDLAGDTRCRDEMPDIIRTVEENHEPAARVAQSALQGEPRMKPTAPKAARKGPL